MGKPKPEPKKPEKPKPKPVKPDPVVYEERGGKPDDYETKERRER